MCKDILPIGEVFRCTVDVSAVDQNLGRQHAKHQRIQDGEVSRDDEATCIAARKVINEGL